RSSLRPAYHSNRRSPPSSPCCRRKTHHETRSGERPTMREPHFWRVTDKRSRASAPMTKLFLTPAAMAYPWAANRRLKRPTPVEAATPVVCVGNLPKAGPGKTPLPAAVRKYLTTKGFRAASLSRGYGGTEDGPLKVDPAKHAAKDVGDEPLMLAGGGEAWISK